MNVSTCKSLSQNRRPYVNVNVLGTSTDALIDTGSNITAISENYYKQLYGPLRCYSINKSGKTNNVSGANGTHLEVMEQCLMPIIIGNKKFDQPTYVIRNLSCNFIIGIDFMKKSKMVINPVENTILIDGNNVSSTKQYLSEISSCPPNNDCYATKDYLIPSHCIHAISIKSNDVMDGDYFVSNDNEKRDLDALIVPPSVTTLKSGTGKIFIQNSNSYPVLIKRGNVISSMNRFTEPALSTDLEKIEKETIKSHDNKHLRNINLNCPDEYRSMYMDLFKDFSDIFSRDGYDLGWTDRVSHRITLKHDRPIHIKQFRIPLSHQEIIHDFVKEMLDRKLLEVSRSRYNSPIFCVKKKGHNKWRPVVDLRKINEATIEDSYVIRDIRGCIDEIGKNEARVFSSMDLSKGFYQQNLEKGSRPFTSFTVPGLGSYQFTVSCFGSHGAPSSFSYLMNEVLKGIKNIISYIDDILCHTKTHEEQVQSLRECFEALRANNLKLSIEKSFFGSNHTEYLGYHLSDHGIQPGTDKLRAVRDFPSPKTVRQIRQFVGLASFFREHIPQFSRISAFLTALTRKDSKWVSGPLPPAAEEAFQTLKRLLISAPIISFPRPTLPFRLYCDASAGITGTDSTQKLAGGLGCVLTQLWPQDKKERVIGYASRQLKEHELNYSAYLLELSAILFGIRHFHHYLYGGPQFTVFTDHKPLETLNKVHTKTRKRLEDELVEYNFVIVYKKGSDQLAADFLSRNAIEVLSVQPSKVLDPPSPIDILELEPEKITEEQLKDPLLKMMYEYIKNNIMPPEHLQQFIRLHSPNLILHNDQLWYKTKEHFVLILPRPYRIKAISLAHDTFVGGHGDTLRTLDRLSRTYWWPKMNYDIMRYIQQCHTCQRVKGSHFGRELKSPLSPLPVASRFNQRVSADLLGPLKSDNDYKYILVLCDAFSKWVELVPIINKQAETVAEAVFKQWICRYAAMEEFLTDNGGEFINEIMDELCKYLGVKRLRIASYNPKANGFAERNVRIVINYLRKFINNNTLEWSNLLPAAQLSYNTQRHGSTGFSPYYLLHFIDPNLPFESLNNRRRRYGENWHNEAILRLQESWAAAKQQMDRLRESQKRSYDREATSRSFNVGDLVMVANDIPKMNTNHKLTWKWIGPFAIIKMNTPLTASIKKTPTSRPLMVNVNRLKHYHSMEMPLSNVFNGYPSHVDDEHDELGDIPKAVKLEPTATPPPTPVTPVDPPSDDDSSFHSPPTTPPSSPFARTRRSHSTPSALDAATPSTSDSAASAHQETTTTSSDKSPSLVDTFDTYFGNPSGPPKRSTRSTNPNVRDYDLPQFAHGSAALARRLKEKVSDIASSPKLRKKKDKDKQ